MGNANTNSKRKKALIYDPYLDTLGGGERYTLTIAELLLNRGWDVAVSWSGDKQLIKRASSRFAIKLDGLRVIPNIFASGNFVRKYLVQRSFDFIFYVSDGSIPTLFGKTNYLHFQVPFLVKFTLPQIIVNRVKMLFINRIVCNSHFTQAIIQKSYHTTKAVVCYPPVDVQKITSATYQAKKNIILAVGRFDDRHTINSKRQDVLVEAFKVLVQQGLRGWTLVLVGNSLTTPEHNTFITQLKKASAGLPIVFEVNCPFSKLQKFYTQSKLFWHAAGFAVDEVNHPEYAEHFGMTPVEAMAAGVVPLVTNRGGLKEVVNSKVGFRWETQAELVCKTNQLISDINLWTYCSKHAITRSRRFSKEKFTKTFLRWVL